MGKDCKQLRRSFFFSVVPAVCCIYGRRLGAGRDGVFLRGAGGAVWDEAEEGAACASTSVCSVSFCRLISGWTGYYNACARGIGFSS